jgi:pyruvate/2-oxoglutarate dehydrogenase complex dihydrolipoamide dehydrogenase (E3) component
MAGSTNREAYDLVVLGGGSAGETAAGRVAAAGRSVALVESRLVGGECPYWGCVPSKALLIAASRRRQAGGAHTLGAAAGQLDLGDPASAWKRAVRMRDDRAEHLDDSAAVKNLTDAGVDVIRGRGHILGPGRLSVGDREVDYENLLISVGADAAYPPIPGLRDVDPWTSDDALISAELPSSMLILGGGAIGVELAQVYSTFGTKVTVVEAMDRLLAAEEPEVSAVVADVLSDSGVEVHVGKGVDRVTTEGTSCVLHLADGTRLRADRLLVATGRKPRLEGYGLENIGVDVASGAIPVESDGRVPGQKGVYAAGDVTGQFPFTHTANYAGRVIAANILGRPTQMDLTAVPRGVYIDPPVAGVGLTAEQARQKGLRVLSATTDVGGTARAWLEDETGVLVVNADADRGTLVGGSAIGPRADEWISQVTLAVRAQVPVATLVDTIQPFPAVSETLFPAYESLLEQLRPSDPGS